MKKSPTKAGLGAAYELAGVVMGLLALTFFVAVLRGP